MPGLFCNVFFFFRGRLKKYRYKNRQKQRGFFVLEGVLHEVRPSWRKASGRAFARLGGRGEEQRRDVEGDNGLA